MNIFPSKPFHREEVSIILYYPKCLHFQTITYSIIEHITWIELVGATVVPFNQILQTIH